METFSYVRGTPVWQVRPAGPVGGEGEEGGPPNARTSAVICLRNRLYDGRCRANVALARQWGPESVHGFQENQPESFELFVFRSAAVLDPRLVSIAKH